MTTFPTCTDLLDDFGRADVSPIDGTWTSPFFHLEPLQIVSSGAGRWVGGGGGSAGDGLFTAATYGPNVEVYATIDIETTPASALYYLYARCSGSGGTAQGYGGYFAANGNNYIPFKLTSGVGQGFGHNFTGATIDVGDSIGLSVWGTDTTRVTMYIQKNGVWYEIGWNADVVNPIVDPGYVGILSNRFDRRLGAVYGGTMIGDPDIGGEDFEWPDGNAGGV